PITREWRQVKIPFTMLNAISITEMVPWSREDLVALSIEARSHFQAEVLGDFELEIDWVRLY
ncbi:MAG: hypothetical protein ACE5GW_09890, partial [Planctomycetota bacterium]